MESSKSENYFGLKHLIFGSPSNHEFLLVPGICLNHEMFTKTYDLSAVSWVDELVKKGFCVHVLDWQDFHPPQGEHFGLFLSSLIVDIIYKNEKPCTLVTHSTSGAYGWKILEQTDLVKNLVALAPAPFGNIQRVFEVGDTDSEVIFTSGEYTYHIDATAGFSPDLLWVQEKLVGHAPQFPEDKQQSLLGICKTCDPRAILERFNTNGSQINIDENILASKKDAHVFVVTGDFDPPHPYSADNAIVEHLKKIGLDAEFVWLPDYGLTGHGHMFSMEKGSTQILDLVCKKLFNNLIVQDMGTSTEKSFRGESNLPAVIKTYKDSVGIFSKAIADRLGYGGIPAQYESLADFGSFSGEFIGNLINDLLTKNIAFKRIYGLEVNRDALEKNTFATNKIITDLANVPIEDDTFDISVARYVLQWNSLTKQSKIIHEIARTTKNFAVIQHPTVDDSGQLKFHEIFEGKIIPALKRTESFYSTKEQVETMFKENGLEFEMVDMEKVEDISDIFIERYSLGEKDASELKKFLGGNDWWNRVTWIIKK